MAKSVAYCKRLRYIYELSLEREVEEDGERERERQEKLRSGLDSGAGTRMHA